MIPDPPAQYNAIERPDSAGLKLLIDKSEEWGGHCTSFLWNQVCWHSNNCLRGNVLSNSNSYYVSKRFATG